MKGQFLKNVMIVLVVRFAVSFSPTSELEMRILDEEHDLKFWRGLGSRRVIEKYSDEMEADRESARRVRDVNNAAAAYCVENGFEIPEIKKDSRQDCVGGLLRAVTRRRSGQISKKKKRYVEKWKQLREERGREIRIAIYEPKSNSRHSEVIGMFLQTFKTYHVDIFVEFPFSSALSFVHVYKEIQERFGTFGVFDAKEFDDRVAQHYDFVYIISARDNVFHTKISDSTLRSRCVLVCHELSMYVLVQNNIALYVLSLSPLVDPENYFLPILDLAFPSKRLPPPRHHDNENFFDGWMRLAVIGFGNPGKSIDDIVSLVHYIHTHKLPVRIHVVTKGTGASKLLKSRLEPYLRVGTYVSWIERCPVSKLLHIVRLSRFVFTAFGDATSSYRRLRLSGSISLALSLGTPMLIDDESMDSYDIPRDACVRYNTYHHPFNAEKLMNRIMSQSNEEYMKMRSSVLKLASKNMQDSKHNLFYY